MAWHNQIFSHSRLFWWYQMGGTPESYNSDRTGETSTGTVWLLIGLCAILVYFYMKRNKALVQLREREHQEYLRWMKTDPEETLRRRLNNARKAKLVATLQEEHAKLSAENAERRKKKYLEELNKKLADIEHLNSMTSNSTSVIKSQVHKTKYGGVLSSGSGSPPEPMPCSSRSIPTNHCNPQTSGVRSQGISEEVILD